MRESACCSVCSKQTSEGIYVLSVFLCHDCEQEMVRTPVEDPKYQFFVDQMSKAHRSMIVS
ncbi:sigma factor G inhibitor Gin [Halobacillus litoralis]|uniref:sigma factor G inhibitor Gin n=1 Tax=Halobacillus litoralis TaxID=45668 RepID=UPI001CD5D03F|nr:sigma factor G inhibitor Gin [Halobacillus litoralis]MCA0972740.1 sigma factor G inhibitor Gin [Halobacillus litoralis]